MSVISQTSFLFDLTVKYLFYSSDKCSTLSVELLVDAVFSPYVPYLLDYPTLQQAFLTEQLQAMRLVRIGFKVLSLQAMWLYL